MPGSLRSWPRRGPDLAERKVRSWRILTSRRGLSRDVMRPLLEALLVFLRQLSPREVVRCLLVLSIGRLHGDLHGLALCKTGSLRVSRVHMAHDAHARIRRQY